MVRVLAVVAAAVSIVVIALLIAAVTTPKWLKYVSSADTGTVKTDIIADIGLWTSCLDVTVTVTITIPFVGTTVTTTPSYSCVDSIDASIDPYFPNDIVKICRAFLIISIILTTAGVVVAFLYAIPFSDKKPLAIVSVVVAGTAGLFLVIGYAVLGAKMTTGMTIQYSAIIGIVATVLQFVALGILIVVLVMAFRAKSSVDTEQTKNATDEKTPDEKANTINKQEANITKSSGKV